MLLALLAGAVSSVAPCTLPPGWEAVDGRHTRYVLLGETHGTEQAPMLAGTIVCALTARKERVLVAIEQDSEDNAALQAVWSTPADGFAERLRAVKGWKGRLDGVGSRAMFALLVRLHALRATGRVIDIVRFNGTHDDAQRARFVSLPGQGPHEAAQAENIRDAAQRGVYDRILVLTGSLHARKLPVARGGGAEFKPMAMQLAPSDEVTALHLIGGGGTMWNCLLMPDAKIPPGGAIPNDAIECGNHAAKGAIDLGTAPFVKLGLAPFTDPERLTYEQAYDGFIWLGPLSGSEPEVP